MNKPALIDSQNSREGRPSVVDWLRSRYDFAGLVHRLDFGTSGLMICAKDPGAAKALTTKLTQGEIERTYEAVILGGSVPGKILPDEGSFTTPLEGQTATTHFRVLERLPNATHVEVRLETGRKHQIRKHFSEAGFPLLGDHLYGKRGAERLFGRPALHSAALRISGEREFRAPLPADLMALLSRLRARPT